MFGNDFESDFDRQWNKSEKQFKIAKYSILGLFFFCAICSALVLPKLMNTGTMNSQGIFRQGDQVIINGEDTGKVVNTLPDLDINGVSYLVAYRDGFKKWHKQKFRQVELVKIEPKTANQ